MFGRAFDERTRTSRGASLARLARAGMGLALTALIGASIAPALEITGEVALETRQFPADPGFAGQSAASVSPSVELEPEIVHEWSRGAHVLTLRPFLRVDAHDPERTHLDLREASWLTTGSRWSLLAGVGKVFWGVTEARHLVDVVNQTDGVEDVDGEDKLGQPMVNLTLDGSWGSVDFFYLPVFRARTFPGSDGRLRGPLRVSGPSVYESSRGRWHPDVAIRWSSTRGDLDVALSHFSGTSREPRLVAERGADGGLFRPHYDLIEQSGLEAQLTTGPWLVKLEAIRRAGHGETFAAAVAGVEHTFFGLGPGPADLGVVGELMVDGRGRRSPATAFDHDVFVGLRWALNDVDDTSILGGPIVDYETGETIVLVEAERRLRHGFTMEVEARWFMNTEPGGLVDVLRRDRHVTLRLTRYF